MDLALTGHARARMQQRRIRYDALDCLLEFGREAFDHRGHAVILYFDKKARRRLSRAEPGRKDLERLARCYAVLSREGAVITVGHRHRRIGRQ
jgi:hypothetical protein